MESLKTIMEKCCFMLFSRENPKKNIEHTHI
jgi:hypothetical protein